MNTAQTLILSLKKEIIIQGHKPNCTYMKLVEIFPLQKIETQADHKVAISVVEKIIDFLVSEKNADEGFRIYLQALSDLVNDYESTKFITTTVTGRDMLAYLIELHNLKQSDLAKELGGQPIVSKILNGERDLNIRQIKALAKRFKVSPAIFI